MAIDDKVTMIKPAVNRRIPPTRRYMPGRDWFFCWRISNRDLDFGSLNPRASILGCEIGFLFVILGFLLHEGTGSLLPCIGTASYIPNIFWFYENSIFNNLEYSDILHRSKKLIFYWNSHNFEKWLILNNK